MKTFFNASDSQTSQTRIARPLSDLRDGESARIMQIQPECSGLPRRRLLDLGFVPGTKVTKLGSGLFHGPSRFAIRGNVIALRDDHSSRILAQSV
jgi:DtxR family transcriptional regulator, Mn-dependent transcriptional regulator